jgi:hypothetical protein
MSFPFIFFFFLFGLGVLPQALPASGSDSDSDTMALIDYDPPAHSRPSAGSNPISVSVGGSVGNSGLGPRLEVVDLLTC